MGSFVGSIHPSLEGYSLLICTPFTTSVVCSYGDTR